MTKKPDLLLRKVDRHMRVAIPPEARKALGGIVEGDYVTFQVEDDEVRIRKATVAVG